MVRTYAKAGFTLIELLVVIAIIALLATLIVGQFSKSQMAARDAQRKSDLSQIAKGAELLFDSKGTYFPNGMFGTTASGSGGAGDGWFNYLYSGYPTVGTGYVKAGYYSSAPHDPFHKVDTANFYQGSYAYEYILLYNAKWSNLPTPRPTAYNYGYCFYADLENPSASDIATFNNNLYLSFTPITSGKTHSTYNGMNYAVCNP
ncbi:type II secretion system GspH family protein [Patescibacteria group bacterium]|nr:type II secretion system GspH family protein [Patescibacteria group bacterium]